MAAGGVASIRIALGESLVVSGRLAAPALERAQRVAEETGERLEIVLSQLGLVSERDVVAALADLLSLPVAAPSDFPADPVLPGALSRQFLKDAKVVPLSEGPDAVVLAVADPLGCQSAEAVAFAVGRPVQTWIACPSDVDDALERLYGDGRSEISQISEAAGDRQEDGESDDVERLKDIASEAPVIRLVNLLIARAVEQGASDIHIEPFEDQLRVRYRVDGVLHEVESPPQRLRAAVVSRIKVMAKLNIAERRLAQDGRIKLAVRGRDIDFRISTTPTIHGESVVLRILDRGSLKLDFAALGFDADLQARLARVLDRPHGIVLVTGPTGSGKTTTLYAALQQLNTPDKKILTIEDPVEFQLKGVNQVQVKPQIGLTFATALRSFLRQDPDIMMIGEVRDLETAQIAVQAALTGHLILSTLHTNDAAGAVTRLLDMGVEDYLLTSTVNGLVAQRLVRTLCPHCRQAYQVLPAMAERLQIAPGAVLYRAIGCEGCNGTGFKGRSSIVEVLPMSDTIRRLVLDRAESAAIHRTAVAEGMQTMLAHGMKKALAGLTSAEEVFRVTREA